MDPRPQQKKVFLDFQMMLMIAGLARGRLRSLLWPALPTPLFLFSLTSGDHGEDCGWSQSYRWGIPTKDTRSASLCLSSSSNSLPVPAAGTRNTTSSPSLSNNAGVPGKGGALTSVPTPVTVPDFPSALSSPRLPSIYCIEGPELGMGDALKSKSQPKGLWAHSKGLPTYWGVLEGPFGSPVRSVLRGKPWGATGGVATLRSWRVREVVLQEETFKLSPRRKSDWVLRKEERKWDVGAREGANPPGIVELCSLSRFPHQGEGSAQGNNGVKRKQAGRNFLREKRVSPFPTASAGRSQGRLLLSITTTEYFWVSFPPQCCYL